MSEKTQILSKKIAEGRDIVLRHSTYRHYKGGIYRVDKVVFDTNAEEVAVLYYRIAGPDFNKNAEEGIIFSRPISDFAGMVEVPGRAANYKFIRRFTPVKQVHTTTWEDK